MLFLFIFQERILYLASEIKYTDKYLILKYTRLVFKSMSNQTLILFKLSFMLLCYTGTLIITKSLLSVYCAPTCLGVVVSVQPHH